MLLFKIQESSVKKKQLKMIAHIRNDQFELPDGFYSVSDIQKYIEYTIKKK